MTEEQPFGHKEHDFGTAKSRMLGMKLIVHKTVKIEYQYDMNHKYQKLISEKKSEYQYINDDLIESIFETIMSKVLGR